MMGTKIGAGGRGCRGQSALPYGLAWAFEIVASSVNDDVSGGVTAAGGDYFFLRKKKLWNAAMASGERIRSPKK
jgi:hypothetical protein